MIKCVTMEYKRSTFQLLNEPGLGAGIDPVMALTPFPSSIILDEIRTHNPPIEGRVR